MINYFGPYPYPICSSGDDSTLPGGSDGSVQFKNGLIFDGTSAFIWNNSIQQLYVNGSIDSVSGFKVNGLAPSGNYLRGNGSFFISSEIQDEDLPEHDATHMPAGGADGQLLYFKDGMFSSSSFLTFDTDYNFLGIGTGAPEGVLHIYDSTDGPHVPLLIIEEDSDDASGTLFVLKKKGDGDLVSGETDGSTVFSIEKDGTIDSSAGFKVDGLATEGNVLRGDGDRFISSALGYEDLPNTIAKTITRNFTFESGTYMDLFTVSENQKVVSVIVHITEAFDDVSTTISVGHSGNQNGVFPNTEIIPTEVGSYRCYPNIEYFGADTIKLYMNFGTSTQGAGSVAIIVLNKE